MLSRWGEPVPERVCGWDSERRPDFFASQLSQGKNRGFCKRHLKKFLGGRQRSPKKRGGYTVFVMRLRTRRRSRHPGSLAGRAEVRWAVRATPLGRTGSE